MTDAPAAHLCDALFAALRGEEPPLLEEDGVREAVTEGLPGAIERALAVAQSRTLPQRVEALIDHDTRPLRLPDGSHLPLADAERKLAEKETCRVFAPLREALAAHGAAAGKTLQQAGKRFEDTLQFLGVTPAHELQDLDAAQEALEAFLTTTDALLEPGLAMLGRDGALPVRDGASLARALDLPAEHGGFSDRAARAFARAFRDAAGPFLRRELSWVKAPRALAGVVGSASAGPVRVCYAESLRAARFAMLSEGAGVGVGCALLGASPTPFGDGAGRHFGRALGLSAAIPTLRRALLDESRAEAERNSRVLRASAILRARLGASWVLSALRADPAETDDARFEREYGALASAVGVSPTAGQVAAWRLPPWPGGVRLGSAPVAAGGMALSLAPVVGLHLGLREQYDEAFALIDAPYAQLCGAKDALAAGDLSLGTLFGASESGDAIADWLMELD